MNRVLDLNHKRLKNQILNYIKKIIYKATAEKQAVKLSNPFGVIPSTIVATAETAIIMRIFGIATEYPII